VKIVVTGAGGQLGTEIVEAATTSGHDVRALTRDDLDITDAAAVQRVMAHETPNIIVHAAAWTAVDACESGRERAFLTNATGTANVVRAARAVGATVIYISTDYVFDGTKSSPYVETDVPNPTSVYGASKLAGENEVDPNLDLIVRISWVCGQHGSNMVKTILRLADQQETLTFVDDQIGHPTFADDVATMIVRLATEGRRGVWHVTNQGAVSWFAFAQEVMRAAGHDPNRVKPVSTRDLIPPRPAPRPANSVLDNKRLRDEGIELLDDFRVPLARLVQRLRLG
jgi:dTDP-4-dehydrorhamnose reductase